MQILKCCKKRKEAAKSQPSIVVTLFSCVRSLHVGGNARNERKVTPTRSSLRASERKGPYACALGIRLSYCCAGGGACARRWQRVHRPVKSRKLLHLSECQIIQEFFVDTVTLPKTDPERNLVACVQKTQVNSWLYRFLFVPNDFWSFFC